MDTNIEVNHEKHERQEKTQNHEWTRMDTNIEVNHERHEIHEKDPGPRMDTNGHEWIRMDTNGYEWIRILM
mgnify:CR=1